MNCEECKIKEVFRSYNDRNLCVLCYRGVFNSDKRIGTWKKISKLSVAI